MYSCISNSILPTMIGTLIRNENFATSFFSAPIKVPAQIVDPLLDIPGITAIPCTNPITNATLPPIGLTQFLLLNTSVKIIKQAVNIKQKGKRFPLNVEITESLNKITIATVGKLAKIISLPASPNGFFIIPTISRLKQNKTEKRVATWSKIDKNKKSFCMPKSLFNKTICPLDDTGKNSVNPCTTARSII